MVKVERSALLPYSAAALLALVEDVPRYPEFMPGCVGASVQRVEGPVTQASLSFKLAGMTESFVTENRLQPLANGAATLQMRLLRGPFKSLSGEWSFQALAESACKVTLSVQVDWGAWSLARLLAPQLERSVTQVMQAFQQRAEQLRVQPDVA